jgi:cytochrome P450
MTTANPEAEIRELLSDASFVADPYDAYGTLLERAPLFWSTPGDLLVSPHELCREVLTNAEVFGQRPAAYPNFHSMDPPEHTRLRRLVSRVFTPRAISAYRHRIEHFAGKLLDDLAPRGAMDLIEDFARPLPTLVITEMLGVPYEDGELWEKWANAIHAHTAAPEFLGLSKPAELAVPAAAAAAEESSYFRTLVAKRRKDRSDDIISLLVAEEEDGDRLSEDELLYTLVLLLGAGHHTSVNLIGNGMRALLLDPAQLERVIADPGLIGNAIEEMLRIDPPVQAEPRKVLADTFIGQERVQAGTIVQCLLGAANRDPKVFQAPDKFDVARPNAKQHLSFSVGIHHCLGAPLARAEGQIAIGELLRRLPGLRLSGPPERDDLYRLRGLAKLPVAWTA